MIASGRAARIPQAILSKAFSGELVPTEADLARAEGREYEPASVMIDRILGAGAHLAEAPAKRKGPGGSPARKPPSRRVQTRRASVQP